MSEELDGLADLITKASYVFAALIIIGRLFIYFYEGNADFATGDGWVGFITYVLNTIMIAVTLIVVAVPEGLPMSVTLSLAFSMRKLMRRRPFRAPCTLAKPWEQLLLYVQTRQAR